jgi:hypothetical protein
MKYIRHYGIKEAYQCEECLESVVIVPIKQQPLSNIETSEQKE